MPLPSSDPHTKAALHAMVICRSVPLHIWYVDIVRGLFTHFNLYLHMSDLLTHTCIHLGYVHISTHTHVHTHYTQILACQVNMSHLVRACWVASQWAESTVVMITLLEWYSYQQEAFHYDTTCVDVAIPVSHRYLMLVITCIVHVARTIHHMYCTCSTRQSLHVLYM